MRNAAISSSFNSWCEHAAEQRQQRGVLGRVVARLRNAALAACFSKWLESAALGASAFISKSMLARPKEYQPGDSTELSAQRILCAAIC